jgi:hypothetical protein
MVDEATVDGERDAPTPQQRWRADATRSIPAAAMAQRRDECLRDGRLACGASEGGVVGAGAGEASSLEIERR